MAGSAYRSEPGILPTRPVGCWLIRHGRATPETVLETLAALREGADRGHRRSPETPAQREFVRGWMDKFVAFVEKHR